jgi:uncharacterized protein YgiM (DUF1202 family)
MDKTKLRIISKIGLLLVMTGFFMPVACDQNGFEIAHYARDGSLGIALYGIFAFACLGVILLFVIAAKKKVNAAWDWIATTGAVLCAVMAVASKPTRGSFEFQVGAYTIMCGLALSLLILIMASSVKETPPGVSVESKPDSAPAHLPDDGDIVCVTLGTAVREKPDPAAGNVCNLFGGDKAAVLRKDTGTDGNSWVQVKTRDGKEGWFPEKYLSKS